MIAFLALLPESQRKLDLVAVCIGMARVTDPRHAILATVDGESLRFQSSIALVVILPA